MADACDRSLSIRPYPLPPNHWLDLPRICLVVISPSVAQLGTLALLGRDKYEQAPFFNLPSLRSACHGFFCRCCCPGWQCWCETCRRCFFSRQMSELRDAVECDIFILLDKGQQLQASFPIRVCFTHTSAARKADCCLKGLNVWPPPAQDREVSGSRF
jgi:hypothetical protein